MIDTVGYDNIENILVYDEMYTDLKEIIPFSVSSQQYYYLTYLHTAYIDFFIKKNNKFAHYLKHHSYRELYMPSNAFTKNYLTRLYRLISEKKSDVIFRWSYVLTTVRGNLEFTIIPSLLKIDDDEMAEYLFGSKERIEMLRDMFQTLHSKKISIFIIEDTCNKNQKNFLKWIRYLYPFFNEINLINMV